MYQFSYADIQEDSVAVARDRERQLLSRSIEMLAAAKAAGAKGGAVSREALDALRYTSRVWTMLIEDLGSGENVLPKELRASLISIGLWLLREGEEIRQGRSSNFEGMIEISQIIRDGIHR